jgi:uncharacterized protein (TIGR02246 family)
MEFPAGVVVREARLDEYEGIGVLVIGAYRTLEDVGDEFYESQLRDIAGRSKDSDVLVAGLGGRVVGMVTFADGPGTLAEVDDPDAAAILKLGVAPEARGGETWGIPSASSRVFGPCLLLFGERWLDGTSARGAGRPPY